jgi:DNA adenine methylase
MQPICRWAGGKRSLLPEILEHVPEKFGTYFEPFVGGGAVFFGLHEYGHSFKRAVLNDINKSLIGTYEAIRKDVDTVVLRLKKYAKKNCEDFYYRTRAIQYGDLSSAEAAAWFIYMNRTCFNGLYRVNRKGLFNVPYGHLKNPTICNEENLRSCSELFRKTSLMSKDFEASVKTARNGDVAFFDPPYLPRTGEEFTAYDKDGFDIDDHTRLRDCARTLKKIGVKIIVTNSGADAVRELYARGFVIQETRGIRNIGASAHTRGHMPDVLIT